MEMSPYFQHVDLHFQNSEAEVENLEIKGKRNQKETKEDIFDNIKRYKKENNEVLRKM